MRPTAKARSTLLRSNHPPPIQAVAAEALGKTGRAAKAAIPSLTKALQDNEEEVYRTAAHALENIEKE